MSADLASTHHLRASEGWLHLGNLLEATRELSMLDDTTAASEAALLVRCQIARRAQHWGECYDVAEKLRKIAPYNPLAWLWMAEAAEKQFGGTLMHARAILADALKQFPDDPQFPFHLAKSAVRLGFPDEARAWLDVVFRLTMATDTTRDWKARVKEDADLRSLPPAAPQA